MSLLIWDTALHRSTEPRYDLLAQLVHVNFLMDKMIAH